MANYMICNACNGLAGHCEYDASYRRLINCCVYDPQNIRDPDGPLPEEPKMDPPGNYWWPV